MVDGVSRLACVHVEAFVAAALERCEPALREQPLAAVTGAPPATRVVEINARAWAAGVRPGLGDAEAVVRCPALVRRPASAEAERAARQALLEACLAVSPRLEDAGPGVVYVDLAGLQRLFRDEATLGHRLRSHARAVGLQARVGIAGSRAAADVAARVGPPVHVLPPGGERAALAEVPLTVLPWSTELAATFRRWGLVRLGDLARLPRQELGARLGAAGLAAHDRATGVDREPFRPWTPPPFWEEAQGLDWEIGTVPALLPVLACVLERLCVRLAVAHLAVDMLEVRLALASGGLHARTVALAAPLTEAAPIVALLAVEIEAHPPPAAVTGVALSARVLPRRAAPGRLWHPAAPAPRDLAAILTRLALLVGTANVGTPVVIDSHRPDDQALAPFEAGAEGGDVSGGGREGEANPSRPGGLLALRRLRPPRRVEVDTCQGRPTRVHGDRDPGAAVVACAGPWRLSGGWWDDAPWAHDEWDVHLTDGALWRLTHDRLTNTWLLTALYD